MKRVRKLLALCAVVLTVRAGPAEAATEEWIETMRNVHARFTGTKGTFAQFGDSITFTMAFWSPLQGDPQNMSEEMASAHSRVKTYLKPECWNRWKGPAFGNNGSMTVLWAYENVDEWLARLNPEVAVMMFGSNDVGQMDVNEYEKKARQVVQRCLHNGTIVILTTAPPRSGYLEKSRQFAEAARRIARVEKMPLIDYFNEILTRRPDDWDGSLPKFKGLPGDDYQVPTLMARDGLHPSNPKQFVNDFSDAALRRNGFTLRNYLTLKAYGDVVGRVLQHVE